MMYRGRFRVWVEMNIALCTYKTKKRQRPAQLNINPIFLRKHTLQHSNLSSQENRMRLNVLMLESALDRCMERSIRVSCRRSMD